MLQKAFSTNKTAEILDQVTLLWLDSTSPIRTKTVEALTVSTGYHKKMIESAITNAFEELSYDKLIDFIQNERILSGSSLEYVFASPFEKGGERGICRGQREIPPHPPLLKGGVSGVSCITVLHIGAGNVFTSWLHGAAITLLMGYKCWIKPSTQEPVFAHQWHQSIRMIDATLGDQIVVVSWSDDLLQRVNAVVAYGSDETLHQLRQKTPSETIFIGFGHKISAGVVFKEATQSDQWNLWRNRIREDCELFQLNGCLSPQMMYVEGIEDVTPAIRKPGSRVVDVNATGFRLTTAGMTAYRSLWDNIQHKPSLYSFTHLNQVMNDLCRFQGHLSAVGVAGPLSRLETFRSKLEQLGVTRVCELGQMQRPPLSWRNGGLSLVEALRPLAVDTVDSA